MTSTRLENLLVRLTARGVNPLIALDQKVEYGPIFKGITVGTFKARKPVIMDSLKKALKGKTIAQDVDIEHVAKMLDHVEGAAKKEPKSLDESTSPEQHKAMEAAAHGHSTLGIPKDVGSEFAEADKGKSFDMIRDWAMGKGMSEDDIEELRKLHGGDDEMPENALDAEEDDEEAEDADESEEEKAEREKKEKAGKDRAAKDKAAKDKAAKDKAAKDKSAMDAKKVVTIDEMNAAIAAGVATANKNNLAAIEARAFVRPFVGELPLALDSAEKVHRAAGVILKIDDAETVPAAALPVLIKTVGRYAAMAQDQSDPAARQQAFDAAGEGEASFDKMFPGAARIKQVA